MIDPLPEGVYESLRTRRLNAALDQLVDLTPRFLPVEDADQPHVLARHVASAVERALADEPDPGRRRALVNDLLLRVAAEDDQLAAAAQHLVVLTREAAPGVHRLERPVTPLSSAALLTNAPEEPSLGAELRAELASADRVDLLCAFIRWHGVRVLPWPTRTPPSTVMPVLLRGREELAGMLRTLPGARVVSAHRRPDCGHGSARGSLSSRERARYPKTLRVGRPGGRP